MRLVRPLFLVRIELAVDVLGQRVQLVERCK